MNFTKFVAAAFAVLIGGSSLLAHDAFKDPFMERYNLKSLSCKTCHPNNKDRSIHNKFGDYYEEALKGHDITKKFNAAAEKGEEAQDEYEKEMVKLFKEAMKVVEKKSMTFEDMIKAGMLNGTKLDTKKMADKKDAAKSDDKAKSDK